MQVQLFIICQVISVGICFFTSSTTFLIFKTVHPGCILGTACTTPEDVCRYSEWGSWSECSDVCRPFAQKTKTRKCLKKTCNSGECAPAPTTKTIICKDLPCCEGYPKWEEWGEWDRKCGECALTEHRRYRKCSRCEKTRCPGENKDVEVCPNPCAPKCVGKSVWSRWSLWGEVKLKNLIGHVRQTQIRERKCATYDCLDGSPCLGLYNQTSEIVYERCELFWDTWTSWSRFNSSVPCNTIHRRSRSHKCKTFGTKGCIPEIGCYGPSEVTIDEIKSCCKRRRPYWSQWGKWSKCSRSCGHGIQKRARQCKEGNEACKAEGICLGEWKEERTCFTWCCNKVKLGQWSAWSDCKKPCGGVSTRRRKCQAKKCPLEKKQCALMKREKRPCPKCT